MGAALNYWARLVRFSLLGRLPTRPEEVPIWALTVPYHLWQRPWRPSGRTFERSYAGAYPPWLRRLLPLRSLYLIFLFLWPLVAMIRALRRGRGALPYWHGALTRPELSLLHPRATYTDDEWRWSRPDYDIGMYYATLWDRHKPDYLRLEDKDVFLHRAESLGLPVPRSLRVDEAIALGGAIFVKSPRGDLGFGIQVVEAKELPEYEDADEMILQAPLHNHPDLLQSFPPDAPLSTLRVTTVRRPDGQGHDIARCALRIGRGGAPTDNTAQGGIWANIDPKTGIILPGVTKETFGLRPGGDLLTEDAHPDTGEPFAGMKVPYWDEGRALALRAQAAMAPEALSMGWDVALAAEGPTLLEVNVWTVVYDYNPPDDAFTPAALQIVDGLRRRGH